MRRIGFLLLYMVGVVTFVAILAPLIHWWSIPAGIAAFVLVLKMPYYSRWQ